MSTADDPSNDAAGLEMTTNEQDAEPIAENSIPSPGKGWPRVYEPADLVEDVSCELTKSQQLAAMYNKNIADNMSHRVARLCVVLVVALSVLLFVWYEMRESIYHPDHLQLMQLYGIVLAALHSVTISQFFIMWCTAYRTPGQHLYRIHTLNSTPNDWMSMSISYKALLMKDHPIESISEMSAIQGGRANTLLYGTAQATLILVLCAFAQEITYERFTRFSWSDAFVVIGAAGLVVIGVFELDPNNVWLIRRHYAGVVLAAFCLFAFNAQVIEMVDEGEVPSGWLAFPVLLDVVAFGGLASWQWSLYEGAKFTKALRAKEIKDLSEEDREQISTFSIRNLVSEAVFFICMATSLCSWLIMYREYCDKCEQSQCGIMEERCQDYYFSGEAETEVVQEACISSYDSCDFCDGLNVTFGNITV